MRPSEAQFYNGSRQFNSDKILKQNLLLEKSIIPQDMYLWGLFLTFSFKVGCQSAELEITHIFLSWQYKRNFSICKIVTPKIYVLLQISCSSIGGIELAFPNLNCSRVNFHVEISCI